MTDQATNERRMGASYRLDQPDGTWWELGWDRPLGTFYAQHHDPVPFDPFTEPDLLAWHGTDFRELPTVDALAARVGLAIPEEVVAELNADAGAHPNVGEPPYLAAARRFMAALESPPAPERPDPAGVRSQGAREADLKGSEGQLQKRHAAVEHGGVDQRRWSLPAEPLAQALRNLHTDPFLADDDVATFARGFDLDPELVGGVLQGTVQELGVEQIAQVCEGLRCSPYEVWGPDLASQILHTYGPEHWPRHIEPLEEVRERSAGDDFLGRRLDRMAREIVRGYLGAVPPGDEATVSSELARGGAELLVTCYRQSGLLALDHSGRTSAVADTNLPADPAAEYHFQFRQLADPILLSVPIDKVAFARGWPPGADAEPALAGVGKQLRDACWPAEIDMVRFTQPGSTVEQWLGWDGATSSWQTWDDPRCYYPGDPRRVLDAAGLVEPDAAGLHHQLPLEVGLFENDDIRPPLSGPVQALEL